MYNGVFYMVFYLHMVDISNSRMFFTIIKRFCIFSYWFCCNKLFASKCFFPMIGTYQYRIIVIFVYLVLSNYLILCFSFTFFNMYENQDRYIMGN